MVKKPERRGLGRGLSSLMSDINMSSETETVDSRRRADLRVPIERVFPNPNQPRRDFDPDALNSLSSSIREKGVLQPLIVRPRPGAVDEYEIVAGERRWRASQMAGKHDVPVLVRDLDDAEVIEIAIIENIQRADLNAIEEAQGYRQLMDRFGHTQEKIAEALSRSRSHIANLLRLLNLPDDVQDLVRVGKLTSGHARALITSKDPSQLAQMAVSKGMSVREVERLAKVAGTTKSGTKVPKDSKDADTRAIEQDLSAGLNLPVTIAHTIDGSGTMSVRYNNLDDLDMLCRALSIARRDYARD
jgi:ParB family chromosome partitioning protein